MNKKTENLDRELAVLAALRDSTDLRLAMYPGGTPTRSILELADEGRFPCAVNDAELTELEAAAERLRRQHLVSRRTIQGRVRWFVTDAGREFIARVEKMAGLTELVAAEQALERAEQEERAARARVRSLDHQASLLRMELPRNPRNMLLDAALGKVVAL